MKDGEKDVLRGHLVSETGRTVEGNVAQSARIEFENGVILDLGTNVYLVGGVPEDELREKLLAGFQLQEQGGKVIELGSTPRRREVSASFKVSLDRDLTGRHKLRGEVDRLVAASRREDLVRYTRKP